MRRLIQQGAAAFLLAGVSLGAYAAPISIRNQSDFPVEVSGSVDASSSQALIQPTESATLEMTENSITHLMLIAHDNTGYQDSVLVRMVDGKLSAVSLYGKQKITHDDYQVVLEK
jgi:hypothetical protein